MDSDYFRVTVHLACGLTVIHHVKANGRAIDAFAREIMNGFAVAEDGQIYIYPMPQVCRFLVEPAAEDAKAKTFTNHHDYCASLVHSC